MPSTRLHPLHPRTSLRRLKTALTPSHPPTSPLSSPSCSSSPTTTTITTPAPSNPSTLNFNFDFDFDLPLTNLSATSLSPSPFRSPAGFGSSARIIRRKKSMVELELEEERTRFAEGLVAVVEPRPRVGGSLVLGGIEEVLEGRV